MEPRNPRTDSLLPADQLIPIPSSLGQHGRAEAQPFPRHTGNRSQSPVRFLWQCLTWTSSPSPP